MMIRPFFLFLFGFPLLLAAQSYDASLGLRLGTDWGATAQIRLPQVQKNFVLEGILQSSLQRDEGSFTLLGKQHRPLLSRRLNLFYGAGVHAGWNNEIDKETGEEIGGPVGIDGVVGLEATIGRVNLSYDFKPALNVGGGSSFLYAQTGVSVRYVIAKRNDIWDKQKEKENRREKNQRQRLKKKEQRQKERAASGKRWYEIWKKG
ncbi:hypothetical protein QWY85_12000 [Neolewinella lacunae]|uniref:Uncharacterized protein n=1 Tax=Neolewinella lacunae TaxID=1517758 RepID=A0A923T904_9BACT|nr:hypothetical protein [Neolewinella lacunae]MBC6995066.1 hypothetical protein [Neolewinella lacunae]MDN3635385.1 hypothetical protein [Neolewinella lacunae]